MTKNEEMLADMNETILLGEKAIIYATANIAELKRTLVTLNAVKEKVQNEILKEVDGNA